jgi:hypothetical protein
VGDVGAQAFQVECGERTDGYRVSSNGGGKLLVDLLQPRQPVSTLKTVEKDIGEGVTGGGGSCASPLTSVAGYTTLDKEP